MANKLVIVFFCILASVLSQNRDFDGYQRNYISNSYGANKNTVRTDINSIVDADSEKKVEREVYKIISNPSAPIDMVKLNALSEQLISRANVTEEQRRVVRQIKKQRPGFFWTLFRVTFESIGDTVSTIQQIVNTLGKALAPPSTTAKAPLSATQATVNGTLGANMTTTTTEAPFRLTAQGIATIISRNVKGLIRLFNIEWKDAMDQSAVSVREFKQELGKSISPFLADNPNIN